MKQDKQRRYLMEPPAQTSYPAVDVLVMFDLKANVMEYAKDRFHTAGNPALGETGEIPSAWELW